MLMRSTGLGKTELVGEINHLEHQGDYIILYVNVIDPVKWKLRVGLNYKDLLTVMRGVAKLSIIAFLLSINRAFKPAKHPGDF